MAECNDKSAFENKLYNVIKDLPILDYHCHLSPQEIYEDKQFSSIGDLWLSGDHYKWRLMRTAGVDERYITGDAPIKEKYDKFVEVLSTAFHNPIREWAQMELKAYFNVDLKICKENADKIWDLCDKKIKAEKLSPRKLMKAANVKLVCTTDDVASDLTFHDKLKEFEIKVVPSFRTDNLFSFADVRKYKEYLAALGNAEDIAIDSLDTLKDVIKGRLQYFIKRGCKFSDIGAEGFPAHISLDDDAAETFGKLINDDAVSAYDLDGLRGNLYLFLGKLYKANGIIQQWHLAVTRNANTIALNAIGRDSGFDCLGDIIPIKDIKNMLDALNSADALPETIIYTLNPEMTYPLITLCGSFRGVHMGIAWWFNDHRRGMTETFNAVSELAHIESLVGMLTDSRSFLSYVRHDYFRKLLCEFLAENAAEDDYLAALEVAKKLCYKNVLDLLGGNI